MAQQEHVDAAIKYYQDCGMPVTVYGDEILVGVQQGWGLSGDLPAQQYAKTEPSMRPLWADQPLDEETDNVDN